MMKRVTWFVGGAVAGAALAGTAKKKVRTVTAELTPVKVAQRAGDGVRRRAGDVGEALREGRRAMRAKELELRARLDGRVSTLADELDDDEVDAVLVDGRPVEPGQVIVLRQVRRDAAGRSRQRRGA